MSAPEFSNPASVVAPVGNYSHVAHARAGSDLFYIAGQVGLDPNGRLDPTMEGQTDEAFANIARILEANGLTPANLLKLNIFIVAGQPVAPVRAARLKHFGDIRPASTLVFIPQLVEPKYLIEVEAVACR